MNSPSNNVLAFGGGVDSTALLVMYLYRRKSAKFLGISTKDIKKALPPLSAVIFSDTGAEFPETYQNVELARKKLASKGLPLHVVQKMSADQNTLTITSWLTKNGTIPLMPGGPHVCSLKFKGEVMRRWAKAEYGHEAAVNWLIGIGAAENRRTQRFTPPKGQEQLFSYPLMELGVSREVCCKLLAYLWPLAVRKSSCTYCPFMKEHELRDLYENYPDYWNLAKRIESQFSRTSNIKHQAWLDAGKPLRGRRAPIGMWRRDAWAEGSRLFVKKLAGKQLSVQEWEEYFRAEEKKVL